MIDNDMSRFDFNDVVKDISTFFGAPKDRQLDILYDIFRAYPYDQMKKACRYLIEYHDNRYFPTPRDIHDALREVAELRTTPPDVYDSPEAEATHKCQECQGIGWSIEDRRTGDYEHHVAAYCSCEKGQRMRQGHVEYMRRNHNLGGGQ